MKLTDLVEKLDYELVYGSLDKDIETLVYDSRKAKEGSVFVAMVGAKSDAHKFLPGVLENKASAVVVEYVPEDLELNDVTTVIKVKNSRLALAILSAAYFGYPADKLKTIGITGTKGKTTTTYMVKQILENAGIKTGLIGTIETIIGEEHIPSVNTTPESYIVQEYFRKMVDAGLDCVIMEVSSQALKLNRVGGFIFDYGIFTNLSPDHIGPAEHESFEDYLYCKSLLFRACKHGIFNADDEHLEKILEGHTCTVETYGLSEGADLRASDLKLYTEDGVMGISYKLSGILNMDVKIDIPGRFSTYNSLTAISICRHFGVSEEDIKNALVGIHVRGRVQMVNVSKDFTIMVDYAHNAMSLQSLLETLREYNPKRLVCLFGCGGNRSRDRRFEMGEISSKLADLTIATSDNPRFEEPEDILNDVVTGIKKADGEYVTIIDRYEAIEYALKNALPGDVIVVAGKGHEDYQEIRGVKHHMDDVEMIKKAAKAVL
ncbi:MAG: UDP-N-acetylmuramoyl-L-alanyl-D-glutamate--2,6-diaminopimelate ligase [Lachnospiraceae bacterium]|nr:UDP-N-acetylmuramoyl-L-alanyl-D-glutamate--2,6-diaminopimelate ligase [Lachnospiraceae bacterium]